MAAFIAEGVPIERLVIGPRGEVYVRGEGESVPRPRTDDEILAGVR